MKKGFTLIELLVVVLIIGILSAIALPQYQTAVDKARYSTMMAAVRALKDAQEVYYLANGSYSDNIDDFEGVLPGACTINQGIAQCPGFSLYLEANRNNPYGRLIDEPRTNFHYSLNYKRYYCYAYKESGERAQRLCKSVGGIRVGDQDNQNCGGKCTIYTLP